MTAFGCMKIKHHTSPCPIPEGLREADEIVVLIPLEKWNKRNGFFLPDTELSPGQDITLHGRESVTFPGPGGALVVMLSLSLS
jgi:hypothetical protein